MSRLGIERTTGLIYEGKEDPCFLVVPTPAVSQCKLIATADDLRDLPRGLEVTPWEWVFREDSFDPVSRIRRGRVYQSFHSQAWETIFVNAHPFSWTPGRTDGRERRELCIFLHAQELLGKPRRGEGLRLAIGVKDAFSLWRIVQTEMTVSQDVFVTLRAESVFDALPTLNEEMIHPESLDHVKRAYDRVIAAAYKELPTSVVDQCRNLCAVLVARWLYQHSQESRYLVDDLGPGITSLVQFTRNERRLLVSALDVVNRLHPRGKDNEALKYDLRAVSDEDASLALHATGFVIREIGWAR